MTTDQIIEIQRKIKTPADGFWGPKSVAACQRYLKNLGPKENPWPKADEGSLRAFFGEPGDALKLAKVSVQGLGLMYERRPVMNILCHHKVADSLLRILHEIAAGPHAAILKQFAGVYNNRPMRNGRRPSLHARGAAIDLAPDANGNVTHWPTKATMPLEVMEAFAREGWTCAGAAWSRDAMHFQTTQ
jgi:hypothetical protein